MPNTLEFWKHVPSTAAAIFAIELPYRPPKHPVGAYIWRWRFWLETTIGLSLLEPWEKLLMIVFLYSLLALAVTGLLKYLPEHAPLLKTRLSYYFFGTDAEDRVSVQRLVAGWVGQNRSRQL